MKKCFQKFPPNAARKCFIVAILTCMLISMFAIGSMAYDAVQPEQGYIPFKMDGTGTAMWQIPPIGSFSIAVDTFPEGWGQSSLNNLPIMYFSEFDVLWSRYNTSGAYDGTYSYWGEHYVAGEPTGFTLMVYNWEIVGDYVQVDTGIWDTENAEWVIDPSNYPEVDQNGWYYDDTPVLFYTSWQETASYISNTVLANWILQYYPVAFPYRENMDNWYYQAGYEAGKEVGNQTSYDEGFRAGEEYGKANGRIEGINSVEGSRDLAGLIDAVVMTPFNSIQAMLFDGNLELFGINVWGLLKTFVAILILAFIVIKIVKVLI